MIDLYVILACLIIFLGSSYLHYRNTQFLFWQCHLTGFQLCMSYHVYCHMILANVVYTFTYISFISMTIRSVMTFFLSIKYLSVCLLLLSKFRHNSIDTSVSTTKEFDSQVLKCVVSFCQKATQTWTIQRFNVLWGIINVGLMLAQNLTLSARGQSLESDVYRWSPH